MVDTEELHTLGNKCCTTQKGREYWSTESGDCRTVVARLQQTILIYVNSWLVLFGYCVNYMMMDMV